MTKDDIIKLIEKENIQYIRLMFTDLLGRLKNVEIPATQINRALNNKVTFDGSSIEGFVRILESDMLLYPDLSTFRIFYFETPPMGKVAGMFCDIYKTDGTPFTGDSRYIARQALKKMQDLGYSSFNIGFEPEFYLLKINKNKETPVEYTDDGSYFDLAPIDGAVNCRRDIIFELIRAGFNVEAGHHEVGPGQHEINFKYANMLEACDNVQLFKLIVKNVAKRNGLHATFMPKIKMGIAGSGMHVNMSLFDKNGANVFYDKNSKEQLSPLTYYFINGIMDRVLEFIALTNPTINSYKRLVLGFEAPCYIAFSNSNRSALIRIPASRDDATRCELRMVDPTCNPYLALSVILSAGLEGIVNKANSRNDIHDDIFKMDEAMRASLGIISLPENLNEATTLLKQSKFVKTVIGEHAFNKFITTLEFEWNSFSKHVSQWEIEHYLHLY